MGRLAWAQMRVLLDSAERPAAYVRLHYMGSETTRQLAAALRRAEADRCMGVIIDLRNNPGVHHLMSMIPNSHNTLIYCGAKAHRCMGIVIHPRSNPGVCHPNPTP